MIEANRVHLSTQRPATGWNFTLKPFNPAKLTHLSLAGHEFVPTGADGTGAVTGDGTGAVTGDGTGTDTGDGTGAETGDGAGGATGGDTGGVGGGGTV